MSKKIIFVDDSKTVLLSAEIALEKLVNSNNNIEVIYYNNPENLIADVENGLTYDLCVTDINMPEMNGFELALNLKNIQSVKTKPIIALTTENSPEMKETGKKVGFAGWLTKPFSEEKLVMALKRVLRIR